MASLPRPISKKHSSNGNGFSSKNAYDGVFDGPPKFGAPPPTFSSRIEDYTEIFGASRASSIPILDLSTLDGGNDSSAHDRRSKLDYSKIFGGLRDEDMAASYQEMFAKQNGAHNSPANTRIRPPDLASGTLNHQAEGVFLSEASKPEGRKQFNMSFHKTGRRDKTWENGTTHVAELHAVPGFTCFFDGNHPVLMREGDKLEHAAIEEVKCPPKEVDIRLSNNKASVETGKSKSEFSGKESSVIGNSSNATENNVKTCPSDMLSSSSIPADKASYKRETKRSMNSYFKVPDIGGDGCSTSYSDEDLDVNSVAGASAAALKRALEKAEASIKIAREMMERKKDGFQKVSRLNSKTSTDVKKSRKDKVADQSSGARKNIVKESSESSSVFLQVFSKLEREKARQRGKVAPDFEESDFIPKRVGETSVNNLGSPKDCEGPQQMSETRNIVECTTETLASDHVGIPDNIVMSVESRASSRKEIEAAKGTLDRLDVHVKELDEEAPDEHGFVAETTEEFHRQPECEYVETPKEDVKSEDVKSKKFEEPLSETVEDKESELQTTMEHDSEKCSDETHDCMEYEMTREDTCEEQNEKIFLREEGKGQSKQRLICELEATRATVLDEIDRENVCEAESDTQIHYDSDKVEGNQKEVDNIYELDIVRKILDGPPDEAESDERHEGDDDWEVLEKVVTDDHADIEAEIIYRDSRCTEKPEVNLDGVRETTNRNAGSCHESEDPNENQEGLSPTRNEGHLSSEENERLSDATHSCETSDGEMGLETDEMTHVLSNENVCTAGGLFGTAVAKFKNENGLKEAVEAVVFAINQENISFTESTSRTKEMKQNDEESEFACNIGNGIEPTVCELGEDEKEFGESGVAYDLQKGRNCFDAAQEQKECVKSGKKTEASQPSCSLDVEEKITGVGEESKSHIAAKNEGKCSQTFTFEEKKANDVAQKELKAEREHLRKDDEASNRHREREKDRMAVERAIREVRERAFAEARERAERAAVERATAEARQRVMAEAREKFEKTYAANKLSTDKATAEAKLRAERAAVERATTEARNRAMEKALSQKATTGAREQTDRSASEKNASTSRDSGTRQNNSSSDAQKFEGLNGESAQRRKARLERHQRTMERAAKALAEKNMRDLLAQKEQAQRNRLADILDADVRRWASGKEGNLRALLSTLQYILGPDSGWQPISLTEIIQTSAVKKAYRKATLHVHPDKLQQRGATIQQKYICEKVFDLLKAAWNRFNSEER